MEVRLSQWPPGSASSLALLECLDGEMYHVGQRNAQYITAIQLVCPSSSRCREVST